MTVRRWVSAIAVLPLVGAGLLSGGATRTLAGLQTIQHVIVIMQENRSYDTYFGTFPGGDGWPAGYCNPNPSTGGCDAPYHDPTIVHQVGGPHAAQDYAVAYDNGRMDGFVAAAESAHAPRLDVMGYKDARELPVYWSYADQFTLQDHLFAPSISYSQVEHLYMVSGWSATCANHADPMSCTTNIQAAPGGVTIDPDTSTKPEYIWTDVTYLLHKNNISWGYYVAPGTQPDCDDGSVNCCPSAQTSGTFEIWNPLPDFATVHQDNQLGNIRSTDRFLKAARDGTLPAVSWVIPNGNNSEHPPGQVDTGQSYVSQLVDAVMQGPDWSSTAIFVSWDEWGGFFDHVPPPSIDQAGLGFRVPGLVISPWAKRGNIDGQTLSHDNYLKFIEDVFLGGQRINPATDGRPDSRPTVRESSSVIGDLANDFNFNQTPAPIITSVAAGSGSASGGTKVVIHGADLTGATAVAFGGAAAASYTVNSQSRITAITPPGSGTVDVTVTGPGGRSTAVPVDTFTYTSGPAVTGISPKTAPPGGATSVTISGSGFTGATAVSVGGQPATPFQVASDSQLTATVPKGTGTVDVTVAGPLGTSATSAVDQLTYASPGTPVITGISPGSGPVGGCNAVKVYGSGFTGASQVLFGTRPATAFIAPTDSYINATAPVGLAGTVDVSVATPSGTSAAGPSTQYTYLNEPGVTGLQPTGGPAGGGTSVLVTGSGFTTATAVHFGGAPAASFTVTSDSRIVAKSPPGTGIVDVTVSTAQGTSPASAADLFAYG